MKEINITKVLEEFDDFLEKSNIEICLNRPQLIALKDKIRQAIEDCYKSGYFEGRKDEKKEKVDKIIYLHNKIEDLIKDQSHLIDKIKE